MGGEVQGKGHGGKEGTKNKYAVACSIIGSIISILMGYDTGVMSGAMLFIKEDLKTNDTQVQVLAGILNLFALVGSLTAGRVSDWVYPLRLRAQGASVGVAINRVMNAGVSMTFVSLYKAVTIGGAFFLFAGLAVVAAAFFFFLCPETQGRPLEEIEEVFSRGWRARLKSPAPAASVELPVSVADNGKARQ
ncbi:hypothetical protein EJB05_22398 [Eragrostis curvula]|uniref:Major facilitator superfamily (MFS) profile domain-containing protein n=1 Tax=Eragrostis curvula TaxID=38414 RepID=A0A5J9V652_9POAL|nr:hypothetical protein EJB05_22398 [Eragrostis curvula]